MVPFFYIIIMKDIEQLRLEILKEYECEEVIIVRGDIVLCVYPWDGKHIPFTYEPDSIQWDKLKMVYECEILTFNDGRQVVDMENAKLHVVDTDVLSATRG
jgi:hypothetical protein